MILPGISQQASSSPTLRIWILFIEVTSSIANIPRPSDEMLVYRRLPPIWLGFPNCSVTEHVICCQRKETEHNIRCNNEPLTPQSKEPGDKEIQSTTPNLKAILQYVMCHILTFWVVLTYDQLEDRRMDDVINIFGLFVSLSYKTNRSHVAVCLFKNWLSITG